MSEPTVVSHQEFVVALDYGQFSLETRATDPDLMIDLLDKALAGAGIAQHDGLVIVLSPHQNNFEMALTLEVWDAPAPGDLAEWEEAFDVHLDVSAEGIYFESPTLEGTQLPVPAGSYHAVITGRGFVGFGWPGSTTPGDVWRIRLWPSDGPATPARLRAYAAPERRHPTPTFAEAGIAAVRRLNRSLDDTANLSGSRSTVVVERRMPGTPRKLFTYFANPSGWLTQMGQAGDEEFTIGAANFDLPAWLEPAQSAPDLREDAESPFSDANHIVPRNGFIACRRLDARPPRHVLLSWTWIRRRIEPNNEILVPPDPQMTLEVNLDAAPNDDATKTSIVRLTHAHVPAEWATDLADYWAWALERADYDFDLSGARAAGYDR